MEFPKRISSSPSLPLTLVMAVVMLLTLELSTSHAHGRLGGEKEAEKRLAQLILQTSEEGDNGLTKNEFIQFLQQVNITS